MSDKETTVVNIHGFEYVPYESHIEAITDYINRIAQLEQKLEEAKKRNNAIAREALEKALDDAKDKAISATCDFEHSAVCRTIFIAREIIQEHYPEDK